MNKLYLRLAKPSIAAQNLWLVLGWRLSQRM